MRLMQRAPLVLLLGLGLLLASCGSNSTSSTSSNTTTSARDLLGFSSSQLGSAYIGDSYSGTIAAIGGTAPYNVRLVGGKLPDGLKFSGGSSASISGTPTTAGSSTFRLEVTDANLSVRSQEFNITVSDMPALDFDAALPSGEVRGETRIPLRVLGARTVRAARYTWKLPDEVKVTGVQPSGDGKAGRPVVFWKQQGQTLTIDFGFRAAPKNGAQVALITVRPAADKPFTLVKPVSGTGSFVTALDGSGKSIREVKTPEAAQAEAAAGTAASAASSVGGNTSAVSNSGSGNSATGTPATSTPITSTPANTPSSASGNGGAK